MPEPDPLRPTIPGRGSDPTTVDGDEVTVTVTDEAREVLADVRERITMQRSQPDGPDCGPVCIVGGMTVGAAPVDPNP